MGLPLLAHLTAKSLVRRGQPWSAPQSDLSDCRRLQTSSLDRCQAFNACVLRTTRGDGTRFTPLQHGATEAPKSAPVCR